MLCMIYLHDYFFIYHFHCEFQSYLKTAKDFCGHGGCLWIVSIIIIWIWMKIMAVVKIGGEIDRERTRETNERNKGCSMEEQENKQKLFFFPRFESIQSIQLWNPFRTGWKLHNQMQTHTNTQRSTPTHINRYNV